MANAKAMNSFKLPKPSPELSKIIISSSNLEPSHLLLNRIQGCRSQDFGRKVL